MTVNHDVVGSSPTAGVYVFINNEASLPRCFFSFVNCIELNRVAYKENGLMVSP